MMDKQSENEAYWAARATAYEEAWHNRCQTTVERDLAAYYEQALADIQRDIAALYGRFAKDNKLSMAEAHRLLTGDEYRVWRMSMEEYLQGIENGSVLSEELDTLAMRSRISRLDKLYAETLKALDRLGRKTEDRMADFLTDAYKDRFYHGIYDVAERTGIMKANVAIDDDTAQKIAAAPWSGKSYSQRIWKNDQQLGTALRTVVSNGLHRGLSVPQMAKMVEDKMHAGLSNARRLVRTEMNYVQNRAAADSIKESGMKYYRFIATLDRRTSVICRSHDGHVYSIDEYRPGENAPPLHPNCRSTIAGSLKGWHSEEGARTARNIDGKTVHVPKGMPYDTWYEKYIILQPAPAKPPLSIQSIKDAISQKPLKDMNVSDVCHIGEMVNQLLKVDQHIGDKQKLKEIFGNFREMGGIIRDDQWAKGSSKVNKEMLRNAFSVYPKAWADYLDATSRKLYTLKADRGFFISGAVMANGKRYATKFDNYRENYVSIHMNGVRKTTPFHEIGHYVEFFNSDALKISKDFIAQRTKDENPVALAELFPGFGYNDTEITKKDDFINPYIGKEYTSASEVLSMGLEQIYEPTKFVKSISVDSDGTETRNYAIITDDREYLNLIIGLILMA